MSSLRIWLIRSFIIFADLKAGNKPVPDGDKAFDPETFEPGMEEILGSAKVLTAWLRHRACA